MNIAELTMRNARRWANAKVTRGAEAKRIATRLVANKPRYVAVERATGVPWFIVAVIHEREAAGNFKTQLGQGDPLDRVSTHVPRGRGPFSTWEEGAYDALVRCAPYAARWKDWSPGGAMSILEQYNGLGYAARAIPSPYVWAGTDQYQQGKYIADGVFSSTAVDKQMGCAALILAMRELDPSIEFGRATAPLPPDVPKPAPVPVPADDPWWMKILKAIFKRG